MTGFVTEATRERCEVTVSRCDTVAQMGFCESHEVTDVRE